jgi:hypothetical protein
MSHEHGLQGLVPAFIDIAAPSLIKGDQQGAWVGEFESVKVTSILPVFLPHCIWIQHKMKELKPTWPAASMSISMAAL